MEQGTGRIEKAAEESIESCKSYRICLPILNPGLIIGKSMEGIHEEAGSINDEIKVITFESTG